MPSAINAAMRETGWNVLFYAGKSTSYFAGLLHLPGGDHLTFRRVLEEMQLCFKCPIETGFPRPDDGDNSLGPWAQIGFFLDDSAMPRNPGQLEPDLPQIVSGADLVLTLPLPPPTAYEDWASGPNTANYRLLQHRGCQLASSAPLSSHIQAGCARHISQPTRRHEPAYLPVNRSSSDPRIASMASRRRMRATGSQSPNKRSASGSASPQRAPPLDPDSDEARDLATAVTPSGLELTPAEKQLIANFRTGCLASSSRCAVTGKGRSWCANPAIGPALHACHIVPQLHYNVYPSPDDSDDEETDAAVDAAIEFSQRRLKDAWYRTWSPHNGIVLLSHLHDMFDSRMFSIHPDTLVVRVFLPYDVLTDYHGRRAQIPRRVDRRALRHHYDMCCIENMAASSPPFEVADDQATTRSGTTSPFDVRQRESARASLQRPAESAERSSDITLQSRPGDPSKRSGDGEEEDMGADTLPGLTEQDDSSAEASFLQPASPPIVAVPGPSRHGTKRVRDDATEKEVRHMKRRDTKAPELLGGSLGTGTEDGWNWDAHLTPWNEECFLGDVNWALKRVARQQE
ncbi:hypothetical protein GE09DRAFT_631232 [Coniochaeta sp. 2T2.1]|nr:hypothetical protein GE09DRAFT_631232 [Coniochaeta sp. 2T2.1]